MGRVFVDPENEDGLMIFIGGPEDEWSPDSCIQLWRNGKITKIKGAMTHREAEQIHPPYPEDAADLRRFLKTGAWE